MLLIHILPFPKHADSASNVLTNFQFIILQFQIFPLRLLEPWPQGSTILLLSVGIISPGEAAPHANHLPAQTLLHPALASTQTLQGLPQDVAQFRGENVIIQRIEQKSEHLKSILRFHQFCGEAKLINDPYLVVVLCESFCQSVNMAKNLFVRQGRLETEEPLELGCWGLVLVQEHAVLDNGQQF